MKENGRFKWKLPLDRSLGLQSLGHFQTFWANDLENDIFFFRFLGNTFNFVIKSAKTRDRLINT